MALLFTVSATKDHLLIAMDEKKKEMHNCLEPWKFSIDYFIIAFDKRIEKTQNSTQICNHLLHN